MVRKLPLRQPGRAALDLRGFWIEQIEYQEAEEAPAEFDEPSVRVSRPNVQQNANDKDAYLMTLRIRVSQGDVRSIDLTLRGVFHLEADDRDNEETSKLLIYNGSAMLYGAARGIIESVTSLTGFGRLPVPSANLAKLLNGK